MGPKFSRAASRVFIVATALAYASAGRAQTSTTTYTYDALGRVTAAIVSPSGKKVVYAYDDAGNRTQVGNGVTFGEIIPTALSASTTQSGAGGLSPLSAMRDQTFNSRSSIHVTQSEAGPWVRADLGTAQNVDHIQVAAAFDDPWGIGPWNLNAAIVEYSVNGTTWTTAATVTGVVSGSYASIRLGGVSGRYFRLRRATTGQLALGDFRFYSSDDTSNEGPTAVTDSAVSNGGGSVNIDVLANDTDPENNPLSISSYTQPAHGTVTTAGSQLNYAPSGAYTGADSFTYTISDGHGATAVGNVAMTVNAAANGAPTANNDSISTPAYMRISFDPRTNDSDPNSDQLSIVTVSAASHGTATINYNTSIPPRGVSITYNPSTAYTGSDSFTYSISDGKGGTASASVSATLSAGNPAMLAVMQPGSYGSLVTITGPKFETNNDYANVYVNQPMVTGKYYWEVKLLCGVLTAGAASDITTARAYGGYSSYNAGVYTYNLSSPWPTGTFSFSSSVANDIFGFAYNASTRTLRIYKNNVLGTTTQLSGTAPAYPFSGIQAGFTIAGQSCPSTVTSGRFQFGAGATTYSPPVGYQHLSDHPSI